VSKVCRSGRPAFTSVKDPFNDPQRGPITKWIPSLESFLPIGCGEELTNRFERYEANVRDASERRTARMATMIRPNLEDLEDLGDSGDGRESP